MRNVEYQPIVDSILEALEEDEDIKAFNPERDYPKIDWSKSKKVFKEQAVWINDRKIRKLNRTGRQKGKSNGNVFDQLDKEFLDPGSPTKKWKGFFMETGDKAKDQYWNLMIDTAKQEFGIKLKEVESKNMLIYPSGCPLHFRGLDNMKQVNWIRGLPFFYFIVDECGSLNPEYFFSFLTKAAKYAIYASKGRMGLTGTPALTRHHYWNELIQRYGDEAYNYDFWCNTFIDREHTKNFFIEDLIDLGMKPEDIDPEKLDDPKGKPPSYVREVLGLLEFEDSGHCFEYKDEVNDCAFEDVPYGVGDEGVEFILAGDPAYNDNAAIGVWAYSTKEKSKHIYLVEEFSKNKVDTDEFVEKFKELCDVYNPVLSIIDAKGSGGKMLQATLARRYGIYAEPAQQKIKAFGISAMASAIRKGEYRCPANSVLRGEIDKVEWDSRQKNFDRKKFHGDIVDCAVYAYIEAYNFLYKDKKIAPREKSHKEIMEDGGFGYKDEHDEWIESMDIT